MATTKITTDNITDGAITSAKLASGVGGVAGIVSSADATAITITSGEEVGIGNASPQVKFVVGDGTNATGLEVTPNESSGYVNMNAYDRGSSAWRTMNIGGDVVTFNISATEKMRVNSTGVGIGVTPTHNFNLQSAGAVEARFRSTDNSCSLQISSDADEGQNSELVFMSGTSGRGSILFAHHPTAASQQMVFKIGDNLISAMKITGTGVVLAGGTTAPNYPGTFTSFRTADGATANQNTWGFNASSGGSNKDYAMKVSGTGDYAYGVLNYNENTWMSRLGFDGRIYLTNTTIGSISDRRLKENIVDANSQWNDIKALQFKNYTWKNTERGTGTYLGLIADEVKVVSPSLVEVEYATKETLPENGIDPEYEGVKYSIVWMKAVKALQEAMTKIETLEARIETLENA